MCLFRGGTITIGLGLMAAFQQLLLHPSLPSLHVDTRRSYQLLLIRSPGLCGSAALMGPARVASAGDCWPSESSSPEMMFHKMGGTWFSAFWWA